VCGLDEDEMAQVNAEMRFLTLELMKIAVKRRVSFRDVSCEFIQNVYLLKKAIRRSSHARPGRYSDKGARTGSGMKKNFGGRP
jgi:hypothetical protein